MNTEDQKKVYSYLSFRLGHETFAVNVGKVIEILEVPRITKVPKAPSYMRGVINLRGTVLPVLSSRLKFGLEAASDTVDTCIVVFNISIDTEQVVIGALVDAVQEVFEMDENELLPPPGIGGKYKNDFIKGMAKVDEDFVMVLDVDKIFSNQEIIHLQTELEESAVN
jgi:purine-binding chemotaxis protein CheW